MVGSATNQVDEVFEFMRLLWAVDHQLQSTSKRMEASLGLTGPQRLVVRMVGRFPGITAGRLAQLMHLHPSTITGILKRLEKLDMVHRSSDPLDRRKALFTLTEAGRALDVPSPGTVESAVERAIARMPEARLMGARDVLIALAEELGVGQVSLQQSDLPQEAVPAVSWGALGKEEARGSTVAKAR